MVNLISKFVFWMSNWYEIKDNIYSQMAQGGVCVPNMTVYPKCMSEWLWPALFQANSKLLTVVIT